ncbi:MAG: cyanophycinase [Flavobacteriales bacterium]
MKNILLLSFLASFFISINTYAQPYTSWKVGNINDVTTTHQKGYVLPGGGGDNDEAITWILERAQSGDVVVLRASGSDGYNSYLYSSLGVTVNSVETLLIPSIAAANDPYVLTQVANAEVVFIAGGDQYQYYLNWRGTLLNDTLNHLINNKQITIGGTSAGMMILGKSYYAPDDLGVLSSEALSDPYHQYMSIIGRGDFVDIPVFQNVIMDTHFDDRSRAGRLSTFMARMEADWGVNSFGIACNEYTAVCVDENNIARVFGESPTYPDYAYFVQSNCDQPFSMPDNCTAGQPLHWVKGNEARRSLNFGRVIEHETIHGLSTQYDFEWDKSSPMSKENILFQFKTKPGPVVNQVNLYRIQMGLENYQRLIYRNEDTGNTILGNPKDPNTHFEINMTKNF